MPVYSTPIGFYYSWQPTLPLSLPFPLLL